ncbi:putative lipoprotein [Plesiocystis pacifica SIR-1]|uniref:Putative lipoprotein n=1 Tax=Plesiocystis pacifica SIR-1 TaxID=391625 RepID=A6GG29_9BACT|nr:putative lipoprotein [Plesiocystis pacifica SIR-1]
MPLIGALVLFPACFSTDGDKTDDVGGETDTETGTAEDSTDTTTETTEDSSETETETGCEPGTLDCECDADEGCIAGLYCIEGICAEPSCGNGVVEPEAGEECDDGNDVDDDACSNDCIAAACGDGVVQQGEECDDGNQDDTDACSSDCVAAYCGDGIVQIGEGCDDGNDNDFDECSNDCSPASCGDGVVNGTDECDDGNSSNTDGCTNACNLPACGDGYVQQGEECDDGNGNNNDGCTNSCQEPDCDGVLLNPGNGILGCWYTAPVVGQTCAQVCASHGGFNSAASKHSGNDIGNHFYPNKADRGNWQTIECSSTDNNTNWGANNQNPVADWSHPACHVNCACNQ